MHNVESTKKGELKQLLQSVKIFKEELNECDEANKNYIVCALEIKTLKLATEEQRSVLMV